MNITLYTGPSRSANLQELLQRTPVGSGRFCALVPDPYSAECLERMATATTGGAALGIRICTFDRLARLVLALDGNPPAHIPAHLRSALIREIIRSRIGTRSRWHEVSSLPGFSAVMRLFLEDVRSGRGDVSHNPELAAVARAYESHLARMGMADHEGLVIRALEGDAAERFARSFEGPFIVEGFYDMTPHQYELVRRLASSFRRCAVSVVTDPGRPELFTVADAFVDQFRALDAKVVTVATGQETPLTRIQTAFTGGTVTPHPTGDADGIEVHTFRSESAEADWIAGTIRRLIADTSFRADDIIVVTRHAPGPANPLLNALQRHGVPVEGGCALRLDSHPLVRCILDALDAALAPDEELVAVVQRSVYTFPSVTSDDYAGSDSRAWTSMIAETDTPGGFCDSLRLIIDDLGIAGAVEAEPDDELHTRDQAALDAVGNLLEEFSRFYRPVRPMMHAREFVSLFTRLLSDAPPVTAGPKYRGVLIAELNRARFVERRLVFLTGLGNESFPARHDRFSLHAPHTADAIRRHAESEEALLFYLAGAGAERMICTYPGLDDEGSDAGMSPYLRELMALAGPACQAIIHTGVPGAAWEGGAVSVRGRHELAIRTITKAGPEAWDRFELPEHAESAKMLREAVERYRGQVRGNGVTLTHPEGLSALRARWAGDVPVAITALELYRSCPLQFWYRQVLGLEQDTVAADGLDSRERGILLHEVLASLYNKRKETTGSARFTSADLPAVTDLAGTIIDEEFERKRHELARLHPMVVRAERQAMKKWLALVLAGEAAYMERSPFVPGMFEQSFGMHDIDPLKIGEENDVLLLRGRIDRVDVAGENPPNVRVVDYKTGKKTAPADIRNGVALQLPLYMDAVRRVLLPGSNVREGCYYHLREAGFDAAKEALTGCTVIDGDIDTVIGQAREYALEAYAGIRAGRFPAPAVCTRTCEWRAVCRGDRSMNEEDDSADIRT